MVMFFRLRVLSTFVCFCVTYLLVRALVLRRKDVYYWTSTQETFSLEDTSPFCGANDTPVLDFWWCLPWVESQGGYLCCTFLACVILRFTSGATPADCVEISMAAKPFWSTMRQDSNPRPSVRRPQCCILLGHSYLAGSRDLSQWKFTWKPIWYIFCSLTMILHISETLQLDLPW